MYAFASTSGRMHQCPINFVVAPRSDSILSNFNLPDFEVLRVFALLVSRRQLQENESLIGCVQVEAPCFRAAYY